MSYRALAVFLIFFGCWAYATNELDRTLDNWRVSDADPCFQRGSESLIDTLTRLRSGHDCPENIAFAGLTSASYGYRGMSDLAISPDGVHLYSASPTESAVLLFQRDPATGALEEVEKYQNITGGVDGLFGVFKVIVSPNGQFVYTLSRWDDAVTVFRRNATTGRLRFLQTLRQGLHGVDSFFDIETMALSPDGMNLYTVGDDTVNVLSVSLRSGLLEIVAVLKQGVDGVDGISDASNIEISPDGRHIYTNSTYDHMITLFERDPQSGHLSYIQKLTRQGSDTRFYDMVFSSDGLFLYASNERFNELVIFVRDPNTGAVRLIETIADEPFLVGITGLAMDANGEYLYASAWVEGTVIVFARDQSNGELNYQAHRSSSIGETLQALLSPDGQHFYTTGPHFDGISTFSRDPGDGLLTFSESLLGPEINEQDAYGIGGPVAVSSDGRFLYSAVNVTLTVFSRDPETGITEPLESHINSFNSIPGLFVPEAMVLSPDGRFLYVGGNLESVSYMSRDPETGRLTYVGNYHADPNSPEYFGVVVSMRIDPSGRHLYLNHPDGVSIFELDAESGEMIFKENKNFFDLSNFWYHPTSMVMSPDGQFVYMSNHFLSELLIYARDEDTGSLILLDRMIEGENGVTGLNRAWRVVVSPDGAHLYIGGGIFDEHVSSFERDSQTGLLTFLDSTSEGLNTADEQFHFMDMKMSPDGRLLFFAGDLPDVTVYERDLDTGLLTRRDGITFTQTRTGNGTMHLTVSPDGQEILVSGMFRLAIARFRVLF